MSTEGAEQPLNEDIQQRLVDNNADYQSLLAVRAVLLRQKEQNEKDIEELQQLQSEAIENPIRFISSINRKTFPPRQAIVTLPFIDFADYSIEAAPEVSPVYQGFFRKSRDTGTEGDGAKKGPIPWTTEEQKKLEMLLAQFPDEAVSKNRWEKIADAMGTRTWRQVSSRVQKYFIRLAKEGLPIPGRRPVLNRTENKNKKVRHRSYEKERENRRKRLENEKLANPRLDFDEDSEEDKFLKSLSEQLMGGKDSVEYQELVRLRRLEKRKRNEERGEIIVDRSMVHEDVMCDACGVDPVVGVLWHCVECKESVDLCDQCHSRGTFETAIHSLKHKFEQV